MEVKCIFFLFSKFMSGEKSVIEGKYVMYGLGGLGIVLVLWWLHYRYWSSPSDPQSTSGSGGAYMRKPSPVGLSRIFDVFTHRSQ